MTGSDSSTLQKTIQLLVENKSERDALRAEVERLKAEANEKIIRGAQQSTPLTKNESEACAKALFDSPAPSHVGGKEEASSHVDSEGCPTEGAVLRREWSRLTSELSAAQTTIAELKQKRHTANGRWIAENDACNQLRTENAALRTKLEASEHELFVTMKDRDEWKEGNAVLRAERDAMAITLEKTVEAECIEMKEIAGLRTQLATAIAERNKANAERSRYRAELEKTIASTDRIDKDRMAATAERDRWMADSKRLGEICIQNSKVFNEIVSERDSALAACAAKTAALREYGVHHGNCFAIFTTGAACTCGLVNAISPTAGSDFVPKGPMVELARVLTRIRKQIGHEQWPTAALMNESDAASAAAAPFLTPDSDKGEESK
jgi:hypothetical protein